VAARDRRVEDRHVVVFGDAADRRSLAKRMYATPRIDKHGRRRLFTVATHLLRRDRDRELQVIETLRARHADQRALLVTDQAHRGAH
jgi:hypothetical protein